MVSVEIFKNPELEPRSLAARLKHALVERSLLLQAFLHVNTLAVVVVTY